MLGEYEGARDRRVKDRRVACLYPDCFGAQAIRDIKEDLNEIKENQKEILQLSKDIAGMKQAVEDMQYDVDEVKKKLEEKLSRKDAILWGALVMGVLTAIQIVLNLHAFVK